MAWSGLQVPQAAKRGIVTIGNFDGVHRGHQTMLSEVCRCAATAQRPVVVVTFDPHPVSILKPEIRLPILTTTETRTTLLKSFGANEVIVLSVDPTLLNMQPTEFFDEVILGQLEAYGIVEGPDFRFGKDRSGNTEVLRSLCEQNRIEFTVIPPVMDDDQMISSTRIRSLLAIGKVAQAVHLFGHSYSISGKVIRGAGRGRELGIPTANITDTPEMLPSDGVYAGTCRMATGEFATAVSIGPNSTFGESERKIECHLVGYSGDLYGTELSVELWTEIRELQSFESADKLIQQISKDIESVCRIVNAITSD